MFVRYYKIYSMKNRADTMVRPGKINSFFQSIAAHKASAARMPSTAAEIIPPA